MVGLKAGCYTRTMPDPQRRLIWLTVYTVAMAYLESAVVVYLRAIYYPEGFSFPFVLIEPGMAAIEVGREAATLVMLLGVTAAMSVDRWEWFLALTWDISRIEELRLALLEFKRTYNEQFCLSFGVWDIFYYIWLCVFLDWPPSLLTWDILFLIPVPWIGPVLAPILVSVALVVGSLLLLRMKQRGTRLHFPPWLWGLVVTGGGVVILSFTLDFRVVLAEMAPPPFRWWLFAAGMACGGAALALGVSRLPSSTTNEA